MARSAITLQPGGTNVFAVAHSNGNIGLWDFATGNEVLLLEEPLTHASAVAFSPDGSLVAAGDSSGNVAVWDAASGELLLDFDRPHKNTVNAVVFSPDGSTLATISADATILLWDVSQ